MQSNHSARPIIVVKYGGNAIEDANSLAAFAESAASVSAMGYDLVIVHGGGPQINHWLTQTRIDSHFVDGQRYTDKNTLAIVEMALCAQVNKAIVRACSAHQLNAVGISGQDANLITAVNEPKLGLVGHVSHINPSVVTHLLSGGFVPVIAPLGLDVHQQLLNINADFSAAHIAGALSAQQLILMTNVDGLLDANQRRITTLAQQDIAGLINDGTIYGGMLPKIACAQIALQADCKQVCIINGVDPHNLLRVLQAPASIGTRIYL